MASATPGLSFGLSQNINGSDKEGQRAREEFVSRTLESAANVDEGTSTGHVPDPQAHAAAESVEDTEMEKLSDSDDEIEGETPGEIAYLTRLKHLYAKQPDKATQKALLSVLEELSREAQGEGCWKKHSKQRSDSGTPWDQDDDYGYIRLIPGQCLKLRDNKSPLPRGPPPEVAAPTATAFYIKWDESKKSEFNSIAARIITLQVVEDFPSICDLDEIHDIATSHIKYLHARYRRQTIPEYIAKETQRLRVSSASTRKRTLYNHCLHMINAVPMLARHGRLIEMLGLEGTSLDEEDLTCGFCGVYVIKCRKQLSSKVNHLKWQLDLAYSIHFKGPGSKGNQLRKRIDTGLVSNRKFMIPGIPNLCMDPGWLTTLMDVQKDMYQFRDMQYNYMFPQELLEPPEGI